MIYCGCDLGRGRDLPGRLSVICFVGSGNNVSRGLVGERGGPKIDKGGPEYR